MVRQWASARAGFDPLCQITRPSQCTNQLKRPALMIYRNAQRSHQSQPDRKGKLNATQIEPRDSNLRRARTSFADHITIGSRIRASDSPFYVPDVTVTVAGWAFQTFNAESCGQINAAISVTSENQIVSQDFGTSAAERCFRHCHDRKSSSK
jgi:hypothetical protein